MEETRPTLSDEQYREAAKNLYHNDGECEIDDTAVVSVSEDGGAYVQAWVWVYDTDVTERKEPT